MIETSVNTAAIFDLHGLSAPGFWGAAAASHEETGADSNARKLREALEQLGGLYASFGRFLAWRSDLLSAPYLTHLKNIRTRPAAIERSVVVDIAAIELPLDGQELIANLHHAPAWNTQSRTAWVSSYRGRQVYVEVAKAPIPEAGFLAFEKGLRGLGLPELAPIVAPSVLRHFRHWIREGEPLARERSFLNVLSQYRGETLAGYPVPIPELCTQSILCWPVVEGRPVADLIREGDPNVTVLIASAVLEQFYSLSMVDADLDLDAMVVDASGRLHYRRLNNPMAVLPSKVDTGIKYTAAVVAGNAALSAQSLIRLTVSRPPLDLERLLMDEFSGIEPELKVNMWFPATAQAFENNWRALAKIAPTRPLFLDCLHRNLIASGYWNSDAVLAGAVAMDAISEAHWPVVARLIRTQFGMLMNEDSAEEWVFGSGLLVFGAFREMNRLAEEMRENDITVGVDLDHRRHHEREKTRYLHGFVLGGILLFLLTSLRWGSVAPEPWSALLKIVAVGALPAMFWAISRIG